MRSFLGFSVVAALAFGSFASVAGAQSFGAESLTIKLSPQYPQPYQTVTVTPQSTLVDLAAYSMSVTVNNKLVKAGTGGESASFAVGGPGETSTVVVSISGPEGTFTQTTAIRPSNVALIVEPLSTTHPFYLGASLVAQQGRVRLIALADMRTSTGAVIAPNTLVYTWRFGNQVLQAQSGIGRSTLDTIAPLQYRDADISVTVTDQGGTGAGQASVSLEPVTPMTLVYRNGPLLGPNFDEAITGDISLAGDEESFRAVPYYFTSEPSYIWSVDRKISGNEPIITVRTNGAGEGVAQLTVETAVPDKYESANASFGIRFGDDGSGFGFFGL